MTEITEEKNDVYRYCNICLGEFKVTTIGNTRTSNKCAACVKSGIPDNIAELELQEAYRQGKIPQLEDEDEDEEYMSGEFEDDYSQEEILEMFGDFEDDY
jgi:hypothetical protein